jgi:small GTP-binding protein
MGNCNKKPKRPRDSVKDKLNIKDQPDDKKQDYAKVVLIGNSGVGKTSIAKRFTQGKFDEYNQNTVGAAYFEKKIVNQVGQVLCMYIWDTAGGEKYQALAPLYYRVKIKSNV